MNRDEIIQKLRARGVAHAALFGSRARGDNRPDSDIDIMVEIAPDAHLGVWQYVGIVHAIEDLFPLPVDVSSREAQKPHVRPNAERDAVYAFWNRSLCSVRHPRLISCFSPQESRIHKYCGMNDFCPR